MRTGSGDNALDGYEISDITIMPDLLQFEAFECGPEKDYHGVELVTVMTVFLRRDEVRAFVPEGSGSISVVATNGDRFEIAMNDSFDFETTFKRLMAWRTGAKAP